VTIYFDLLLILTAAHFVFFVFFYRAYQLKYEFCVDLRALIMTGRPMDVKLCFWVLIVCLTFWHAFCQ